MLQSKFSNAGERTLVPTPIILRSLNSTAAHPLYVRANNRGCGVVHPTRRGTDQLCNRGTYSGQSRFIPTRGSRIPAPLVLTRGHVDKLGLLDQAV